MFLFYNRNHRHKLVMYVFAITNNLEHKLEIFAAIKEESVD